MDRERHVECRDRHVRHGVRVANHQPRRQPDDRVLGPGRRHPPAVPIHPAVWRLGGRHRFPAVADRGRTRDSGRLPDFRRPSFAEPRDPGAPAGDNLPAGRGRSAELARLGGHDSSSRTQGGTRQRNGLERRRLQCRARGRAGARRPGHRGAGNRSPILDLRGQQRRYRRGLDLVAEASESRREPTSGASGQRRSRGCSPCREQSIFTRDTDARGRVLSLPRAPPWRCCPCSLARHQISGGPQDYPEHSSRRRSGSAPSGGRWQ